VVFADKQPCTQASLMEHDSISVRACAEAPVAVTPVANSGNAWKQCGGLDGPRCVGAGTAKCKDAPWTGFLCPAGEFSANSQYVRGHL
jgi:hypothetical protein